MPDESPVSSDNPFESPKAAAAQPKSGSPTLQIVMVIILSIATAIALPFVFLAVCIGVAVGGDVSGVEPWLAVIVGIILATIAAGLLVFGMIRLGIWLLKPRRAHLEGERGTLVP